MTGLDMKYFVLKPAGDDNYAIASRRALQAYSRWIEQENPDLAVELLRWSGAEHEASIIRRAEPSTGEGEIRCPECGFGRILRQANHGYECTDCGYEWTAPDQPQTPGNDARPVGESK